MAEQEQAGEKKESSDPRAATQISYCPCLKIYHYCRADGTEAFFDDRRLEASIDLYIKDGKPADAEFMALLTGFARRYPHDILSFDEEGKCTRRRAEPDPEPAAEDESVGKDRG